MQLIKIAESKLPTDVFQSCIMRRVHEMCMSEVWPTMRDALTTFTTRRAQVATDQLQCMYQDVMWRGKHWSNEDIALQRRALLHHVTASQQCGRAGYVDVENERLATWTETDDEAFDVFSDLPILVDEPQIF